MRLRLQDPIAMLQSENVGEKPPKGNWLVALLGLAALAWAYYMAVSIKDPLSALIWFFAAVLMVIVATYLLMISGSVVLCRLLKKNKKYYYKAAHFVSVSSMAYRLYVYYWTGFDLYSRHHGAGDDRLYLLPVFRC